MDERAACVSYGTVSVPLGPWRVCPGCGSEYFVFEGSRHRTAGGQGRNESATHCTAACEAADAAKTARYAAEIEKERTA